MRSLLALFAAGLTAGVSSAGPMLQPVDVSSPSGSYVPNPLTNFINQSGLAVGYTSGVTDFDTYVATTLHNGTSVVSTIGFTGSSGLPQVITLDLGGPQRIDALAFWGFKEGGQVTEFRLFADSDSDFSNGTTGPISGTLNASALTQPQLAQVFSFAPETTRYVHLQVTNTDIGTGANPGIGEVAFRRAESAPVPEPATLVVFGGIALAGAVGYRRRKQSA